MNNGIDMLFLYDEELASLKYGDGYNKKLHALQIALSLLGVFDDESNELIYGYYNSYFESKFEEFKRKNNIIQGKVIIDDNSWYDTVKKFTIEKEASVFLRSNGEFALSTMDAILKKKKLDEIGYNENLAQVINPQDRIIEKDFEYASGSSKAYMIPSYNEININANTTPYSYLTGGSLSYNIKADNSFDANVLDIIDSPIYANSTVSTPPSVSSVEGNSKNYRYISGLLTNRISDANLEKHYTWSDIDNKSDIGSFSGIFDKVANLPFFHPARIGALRNSLFDITVVYGADGNMARKIVGVVPISVATEVDASGEPVYDVYEFIAKDIIYNKY